MITWVQEVGQRFLSTRLSADKFPCTTGRQSHRYVKKHFDKFNVYRLLYFPTRISSLVGTSAQIDWALQWTKSSSAWWPDANFLSCTWVVTWASMTLHPALFLSSSHCTALWTNLHLGSRHLQHNVTIFTKFGNSCKQSSIKSWKWPVIISFPWTSFPSKNAHLNSIENNASA